jgi:hypothetical protein
MSVAIFSPVRTFLQLSPPRFRPLILIDLRSLTLDVSRNHSRTDSKVAGS